MLVVCNSILSLETLVAHEIVSVIVLVMKREERKKREINHNTLSSRKK